MMMMRLCMTAVLVISVTVSVLITLLIVSFPLAWDTQELKVLLISARQYGGPDSFLCQDNH